MKEDQFVPNGTTELSLNPDVVRSDLAEFLAAVAAGDSERAVGVYRGPFLDGFAVAGAPEFERWVEEERSRLAGLYARALEQAAEAMEQAGDATGAVDRWKQLARHDPFSSRIALRLMQALERSGERAAAIRHAAVHAAMLREEIGIEPNVEVVSYARRLSEPEPTLPVDPPLMAPGAGIEEPPGSRAAGEAAGPSAGSDLADAAVSTASAEAGEAASPSTLAGVSRVAHRRVWLRAAAVVLVALGATWGSLLARRDSGSELGVARNDPARAPRPEQSRKEPDTLVGVLAPQPM